jgi:nucleoid DNA-binding protein
MTAYSGFVVPERDVRRRLPTKLEWLSDGIVIASQLGTTETTAIVHPRAFTTAMMSAAQRHGAKLVLGRVTGIVRRAEGASVRGVEIDGGIIESDAVVVAMGPWSLMAAGWMDLPAVFGWRSPSLVYDTGMDVPAQALFLDYQEESGAVAKMTKNQLIDAIAEGTQVSKGDVKAVIEQMATVGYKELNESGEFVIPGFVKMSVVNKPATEARSGVNPFTKEPMEFAAKPASKSVKASPLKVAKDAV